MLKIVKALPEVVFHSRPQSLISRDFCTEVLRKKRHVKPKLSEAELDARRGVRMEAPRDTIYGIHPIEICLSERQRKIYKMFLTKAPDQITNEPLRNLVGKAEAMKIPIKTVDKYVMNLITWEGVHQGVALKVSRLDVPVWSDALEHFGQTDTDNRVYVYLDRIIDPMNLGAVIRTCLFMGVDAIFIPNEGTARLSPVVSKASSGALECAKLISVDDTTKFFAFVKRLGWEILGTDTDCLKYDDYPITSRNRLVVLGNEGHGVNEDIVHFFSSTVSVPSCNKRIGSLNVSVTSGVLLSHFTKNKR